MCTAKNERQVEPKKITKLDSNELSSVDPRTSGCQGGQYYNEYLLSASQDNAFSIKIEPSKGIYFLMTTKDRRPVRQNISEQGEVHFDSANPLKEDGEFIIRVSYPFDKPATVGVMPYEYNIKTIDKGLTVDGYNRCLGKILATESDEQLGQTLDKLIFSSTDAEIEKVISQLEDLIKLAPNDATLKKTYTILGTLYANAVNLTAADNVIRRAIERGAIVKFRVTINNALNKNKVLKPPVSKSGAIMWEAAEEGWLIIGKNQVDVIELAFSKPLFNCRSQCDVNPEKKIMNVGKQNQLASFLDLTDSSGYHTERVQLIPGTSFSSASDAKISLIQNLIYDYASKKARGN